MENIIMRGWDDYEFIQSGNGRRLERFGDRTVVRPEPSVLWDIKDPHPEWEEPNAAFEDGEWVRADVRDDWTVAWKGAKFTLKPTAFRHVGIFPEQAANWEWLESIVKRAVAQGKRPRVLNLFGYTGGASIVAALAGAEVCHVDASKGAVYWASENAKASGANSGSIRWIVDDARKFVMREVKREKKYDIILLDPPVFGRGSQGEVWRLGEDLPGLLEDLAKVLSSEPLGFLLNFYATDIYPEAIARLARSSISVLPLKLHSLCLEESRGGESLQTGYLLRS